MLEHKDLQAIQNMMELILERRLGETQKNMEETLERRLGENQRNMEETLERRLGENQRNMEETLERRLTEVQNSMESVLDKRLTESESMILDELERTRGILEKRLDRVEKNVEELQQYSRIAKLESDNAALLLQLVQGLTRRVEALEVKTA